VNFESE